MEDNYEDFEGDVGLGEADRKHAKSNQLEWFKGEKGRSYRVAFMYFHPLEYALAAALKAKDPKISKEDLAETVKKALTKRAEDRGKSLDQLAPYERLDTSNVRFRRVQAHYKEGVGFVVSRLGKDGPEADQVWKTMGDVKNYFTTVLLVYPTSKDGSVEKDRLTNLGAYSTVPWRFGNKVYETLHQRSSSLRENSLSIATQDLLLKCTNTDYQNFDVDVAGPSIWSRNKDLQAGLLARAVELYDKLDPFRELSTADLKIKLGIGGSTGTDAGVSDDEFSNLLDQVVD